MAQSRGPVRAVMVVIGTLATSLVVAGWTASAVGAVSASADLSARFGAQDPRSIVLGESFHYDVYPGNVGPAATGASIEVVLPATVVHLSTTTTSAPVGTSCTGPGTDRIVRCTVTSLEVRPQPDTPHVSIRVRATALGSSLATARIAPTGAPGSVVDPVSSNDTSSSRPNPIVVDTADVRPSSLAPSGAEPRAPDAVAVFEDRGPGTARGVTMTMTVTAGLRITGYATSWRGQALPGCTMVATQVRCPMAELRERDPVYVAIETTAVGTGASSETITAHITATSVDPVRNDRRRLTVALPAA